MSYANEYESSHYVSTTFDDMLDKFGDDDDVDVMVRATSY
jgi:hypothetical protein